MTITIDKFEIPLSVIRQAYYEGGGQDAIEAMRDDGDSGAEISNWRFIHESAIEEILQEELAADPYVLGCFNADFLAAVTGWPQELIEAAQKGEQFEAIGQGVIDGDFLSGPHGLAAEYARADGYGHHFAHYDFETHELAGGWLAFRTN